MTKSTTLNLTQNLNNSFATFVNADVALTSKALLVAGANDETVKGIQITSDDTVARVIDILINNGAADFLLCSVNVPATSGTNGTTTAVDALSAALQPGLPLDSLGRRVLPLKGTYTLKVRNQTQQTAGKTITVTAISEVF